MTEQAKDGKANGEDKPKDEGQKQQKQQQQQPPPPPPPSQVHHHHHPPPRPDCNQVQAISFAGAGLVASLTLLAVQLVLQIALCRTDPAPLIVCTILVFIFVRAMGLFGSSSGFMNRLARAIMAAGQAMLTPEPVIVHCPPPPPPAPAPPAGAKKEEPKKEEPKKEEPKKDQQKKPDAKKVDEEIDKIIKHYLDHLKHWKELKKPEEPRKEEPKKEEPKKPEPKKEEPKKPCPPRPPPGQPDACWKDGKRRVKTWFSRDPDCWGCGCDDGT